MASTATLNVSVQIGGVPEGALTYTLQRSNSTSIGLTQRTTFSSGVNATVAVPANARYCLIVSEVNSTIGYRIGSSAATSAVGLYLNSSGAVLLPVATSATIGGGIGSTLVFASSGQQFATTGLRLTFF